MSYSEEHIGLAAEYVLGTLDKLERVQVETMMTIDQGFRELVEIWEGKLGELHGMVGPIEPPARVWAHVSAVIDGREPPPRDAVAAPADEAAPESGEAKADDGEGGLENGSAPVIVAEPLMPRPANDPVVARAPAEALHGQPSAGGWGSWAALMTLLAALLAAYLAVESFRPDLLPDFARRPPRVEVVKVETPPAGQLVALMQKETAYPGFLMTYDAGTRRLTVRRLMAQPEAGKSFELWLISDKLKAPRSLGLVGGSDFTAQPAVAEFDRDVLMSAVFAVTVEQEGGSASGAPTTAPVFAGRFVETVPQQ